MKSANKHWSAITMILFIALALAGCTDCQSDKEESKTELSDRYRSMVHAEFANKASQYGADSRYLILVDYSIPSNNNRLFLWDTESDGIVEMFWCAHGNGGGSTAERPVFSNTIGSNCSSLGWYLVERGVGVSPHWGYNYHAVDGLDSSNSNARQRGILIHPWRSVSFDEATHRSQPMELDGRCEGCFTISGEGFDTVDRYVKSRQKRILLWAFDGIK